MPRQARRDLEGNYFHILVQGIGKERVFPDQNAKGFYLKALRENQARYPVKIIAFCVMDSHAHILVSVENSNQMAGYFKRVNAEYAQFFNRVYNRVGYVFRDRYKSQLIRDVTQLAFCVAYIHNNPLKAKMVAEAKDYEFSSFSNYLQQSGLVDFDEAVKFFDTSPENMLALMSERTDTKWIEHDGDLENASEVLEELQKRYNLNQKINDYEILQMVILELIERSGASLRQIAELLGINREQVRILSAIIKKA